MPNPKKFKRNSEIALLRTKGLTYSEIGKIFGLSRNRVFDICKATKPVEGSHRNIERVNKKLYSVWINMISRCYNPKSQNYKDYGGRGIRVSDSWLFFENFQKDVEESYVLHKTEYPDDTSIDRIDNDGDYSNENYRWATKKIQANNTRRQKALR